MPRPPEVLKASKSMPSIFMCSSPSRAGTSVTLPSITASQGWMYSLMRPSVDQVRLYLSALEGNSGSAPTRIFTSWRFDIPWMTWVAAMVMKPGARPHCGMKAVLAPLASSMTFLVTATSSVRSR